MLHTSILDHYHSSNRMRSMTSSCIRYTSLFATGLKTGDVGFYGITADSHSVWNLRPLRVYGKFM